MICSGVTIRHAQLGCAFFIGVVMGTDQKEKTDMLFVWFVLVFGICIGALPALTYNHSQQIKCQEVLK